MGNYLRAWRLRRGLTQSGLADALQRMTGYETDKSQISKLEKGSRNFTHEWRERLAKPLGCAPDDLRNPPPDELPYLKSGTDLSSADLSENSDKLGESETPIYNEEVGSHEVSRDKIAYQILELIPTVSLDVLATIRNILVAAPKKSAPAARVGERSNP